MEFIKGTPMIRKTHPAGGKPYLWPTENTAYINPNAITSAVYDPQEKATAIRMITVDTNTILKGDVMREYEERVRRQADDGRDD